MRSRTWERNRYWSDPERGRVVAVYNEAKQRCANANNKSFANYGGRGIKFLFQTFDAFIEELGPRAPGLTLDRIDNDGHYEAGNIRWASRKAQRDNQRRSPQYSAAIAAER